MMYDIDREEKQYLTHHCKYLAVYYLHCNPTIIPLPVFAGHTKRLYDRTKPLSLTEASKLFENESKARKEMPPKPSGGEVFIFRGKTSQYETDWRTDGQTWRS